MSVVLRQLRKYEKDFVRECVGVVHRIVKLFGFDSDGYSPKKTVDHWIYCCSMSEKHPMSFVKHKMAAFYAYWKDLDDKPISIWDNVDKPGVLMGGKVMRFLSKLLRNSRLDNGRIVGEFESLLTTMLYSKKGMPRPNKNQLKQAEKEAFVKLTTVPKRRPPFFLVPWSEENTRKISGVISRSRVKDELVRTTLELFDNKQFTVENRIEAILPPTSANYINSRAGGGVIGMLLGDYKHLLKGLTTSSELIQLGDLKVGNPEKSIENSSVVNIRSTEMNLNVVSFAPLEQRFAILYNRMVTEAIRDDAPIAELLALPEALKTRVISKGPGILYTVCKPLQKFMWSVLKDHPVFKLIGTPVTDEIIQDLIGAKLKELESFLSVDYSDATNNIESWTTETVMNAIADAIQLSEDERIMAIRSLTGHMMEYKENQKDSFGKPTVERSPQVTGQLMGGILSFPILCIVNATILRMTKEIADDRVYRLCDAGIVVNGDDGLLKTTLFGREVWRKIGSFCGLEPSIGKVYFSKEFLNINSTTFNYHKEGWIGITKTQRFTEPQLHWRTVRRTLHYEKVKYINMGLLMGLKRSGGVKTTIDDNDDDDGTFGARCRQLIDDCPTSMQERTLGLFLHLNRKNIKVDLPYFIPEQLGGLGLPSVGRYTSSDSDLRFCRKIFENPTVFETPSAPVSTEWKFWEYAQRRFPTSLVSQNTDFEYTNNMVSLKTIRAKACLEAVFRLDLSKIFCPKTKETKDKSSSARYHFLNTWRKIWTKARQMGNPPSPYVQDQFPKKYDFTDRPLFHVIDGSLKTLDIFAIA